MEKMIFISGIVLVLFVSGCVGQEDTGSPEMDKFSECLSDSGVKMYGSMTCSICAKQKALFGSSFKYVGEIECHPKGVNPQTQLCLDMGIEKTPTWLLEENGVEVSRLDGFQPIEALSELSGCVLEETVDG